MPKSLIVELSVPSGSRAPSIHSWLSNLLSPHRMAVLTISEDRPSKEKAQVLINALQQVETKAISQGRTTLGEALGVLACHFEACEEIMRALNVPVPLEEPPHG